MGPNVLGIKGGRLQGQVIVLPTVYWFPFGTHDGRRIDSRVDRTVAHFLTLPCPLCKRAQGSRPSQETGLMTSIIGGSCLWVVCRPRRLNAS